MENKKKQTPIRKPKQSRNIIVDGHLYYWKAYGPFWNISVDDAIACAKEHQPDLSGVVIWDSENRRRWKIFWRKVAIYEDGTPFYPILPKHVAAYIKANI
jgi:hypothetical protein